MGSGTSAEKPGCPSERSILTSSGRDGVGLDESEAIEVVGVDVDAPALRTSWHTVSGRLDPTR